MLKKHLLEGTITYFDPDFYLELASRQSNDILFESLGSDNSQILERGAIEYLSDKAISSDPDSFSNIQKNQLIK